MPCGVEGSPSLFSLSISVSFLNYVPLYQNNSIVVYMYIISYFTISQWRNNVSSLPFAGIDDKYDKINLFNTAWWSDHSECHIT